MRNFVLFGLFLFSSLCFAREVVVSEQVLGSCYNFNGQKYVHIQRSGLARLNASLTYTYLVVEEIEQKVKDPITGKVHLRELLFHRPVSKRFDSGPHVRTSNGRRRAIEKVNYALACFLRQNSLLSCAQ